MSYSPGRVQSVERPSRGEIPRGYGEDSGGGDTVGLLQYLENRFGGVASFSATYRANRWRVDMIFQEGVDRMKCFFFTHACNGRFNCSGCDTTPITSSPRKTFCSHL